MTTISRTAMAALAVAAIVTAQGCALFGGVTPRYVTVIEEFAPDDDGTYHPTTRVRMETRHTEEASAFAWNDERDIGPDGREYIKRRSFVHDKETDLSTAEALGLARAQGTAQLGAEIGGIIGAAMGQYMQMETVRIEERAKVDLAKVEARLEQLEAENRRLNEEREAAREHAPEE